MFSSWLAQFRAWLRSTRAGSGQQLGRNPDFDLSDGFALSGLTMRELWILYVEVGGNKSATETAQRCELGPTSGLSENRHEHNLIALALNEHFLGQGFTYPVGYL